MRLTIACPEALRDDANQLAMVLGYGPCRRLSRWTRRALSYPGW